MLLLLNFFFISRGLVVTFSYTFAVCQYLVSLNVYTIIIDLFSKIKGGKLVAPQLCRYPVGLGYYCYWFTWYFQSHMVVAINRFSVYANAWITFVTFIPGELGLSLENWVLGQLHCILFSQRWLDLRKEVKDCS